MLFGLHVPVTQCRRPLLATGETAGHEFSETQRQKWCEVAGQNIHLSLEHVQHLLNSTERLDDGFKCLYSNDTDLKP